MNLQKLADQLGILPEDVEMIVEQDALGINLEKDISEEDAKRIEDAYFGTNNEEGATETDNSGEENEEREENFVDASETAENYEEIIKAEQEREILKQVKKQKAKSGSAKKHKKIKKEKEEKIVVPSKDDAIEIPENISIKEFAEKTGIPVVKIIGNLMKNGILATINQQIDYDTAALVASEHNVKVKKIISTGGAEILLEGNLKALLAQDEKDTLIKRSPVVTIMGHVDHGKTSILDVIRKTKVVEGEFGGITQHIGAYQAEINGKMITFLDTPGHEAFTEMRARGAQVTDIAVLVVAANEGIKPQTIESISHAKDAGVPVIVALNKMDLPDANPERVKGELAEQGLTPEDWGGQTPIVPVSALKKTGIDTLLETIALMAEVLDLKANPNRPAIATVIESHLDVGFGPVATVIINTGTLAIQDNFVVGEIYGKVKSMITDTGKRLRQAPPSTPVRLAGFDQTPHVGDILQVVPDEKTARRKAGEIASLNQARNQKEDQGNLEQIISAIKQGRMKELKIILKADTVGSLEAIKSSLAEIKNDEVKTNVIHSGVGRVNESDIAMAEAGKAVVMAFQAGVSSMAQARAEKAGIEVLEYTIIYNLLDHVKKILAGLLAPEEIITELGAMKVLAIFMSKKKEMIIGGRIVRGKATNHSLLRIRRDGSVVGNGSIRSLQREKEAVNEVEEGKECGLKFTGKDKIEVDDVLEFYKVEKKIRTL